VWLTTRRGFCSKGEELSRKSGLRRSRCGGVGCWWQRGDVCGAECCSRSFREEVVFRAEEICREEKLVRHKVNGFVESRRER